MIVMIATLLLWTLSLSFIVNIESKNTIYCPPDFILIGRKCYFFSLDRQTWQDAYWKCSNMNSTLALITKAEQDDQLRNFLNGHEIGKHRYLLEKARQLMFATLLLVQRHTLFNLIITTGLLFSTQNCVLLYLKYR